MCINISISLSLKPTLDDIEWFNEMEKNPSCNWIWRNIDWRTIFTEIGFEITCIYDSLINYWSTDQLESILDRMFEISNDLNAASYDFDDSFNYVFSQKKYNKWISLKDDLKILIDLFTQYVQHNCRIYIL